MCRATKMNEFRTRNSSFNNYTIFYSQKYFDDLLVQVNNFIFPYQSIIQGI